jgi:hypothetical protein
VDAVGVGGDGDVGTGVDEESGAGAVVLGEDSQDGAGDFGEMARREILLAELEEIGGGGAFASLGQQGVASGRLRGGEADTVGDGVAKHGSSVGRDNAKRRFAVLASRQAKRRSITRNAGSDRKSIET